MSILKPANPALCPDPLHPAPFTDQDPQYTGGYPVKVVLVPADGTAAQCSCGAAFVDRTVHVVTASDANGNQTSVNHRRCASGKHGEGA